MDRKVVCVFSIVCVALLSVLLNVAFLLNMYYHRAEGTACDTTRVTVVDTLTFVHPVAKDSVAVRYVTVRLPRVVDGGVDGCPVQPICTVGDSSLVSVQDGCTDSVGVCVPISQRVYVDSAYTAWVSGFRASLDSIRVYPRTEIVRECNYKPPSKWSVGITGGVGYGLSSRRFEPFIGLGITYSLKRR